MLRLTPSGCWQTLQNLPHHVSLSSGSLAMPWGRVDRVFVNLTVPALDISSPS